MEFRILGPIGLYADSGADASAVKLGQTKVRGVLGILAYKAGKTVSEAQLADGLWDEHRPPETRKTVSVYASRLRSGLREAGVPATIHHDEDGYRLEVATETIDYHRFLAYARRGHTALSRREFAAAAASFENAVALWRGTPLSTLRTLWAQHERAAMVARDLLPAYNALFDAKRGLGDHDFVVNGLRPLLAEHPYDEMLAGQWMRVLAADRRPAEIPAFFHAFTHRLTTDMAAQPSEELVRLYRELTARRTPATKAPTAQQPQGKVVGIRDLPRDAAHFTGRDELLAELDELVDVSIVTVDGPPGAGKTALVTHWARSRRNRFADGVLYANLQGYAINAPEDPAIVMSTFITALGGSAAHIPADTTERAAVLRYLLTGRNMLVFLDNVRDSAHVRPLLDALTPCPVVITSRQQLTGLAVRESANRITVGVLADEAAKQLLRKRIGARCDRSVAAVADLAGLCERLPLALTIVGEHIAARETAPLEDLVEDLRHAGRLLDAGPHGDDLSTSLRAAFSYSYHALSADAALLFQRLGLHPTPRFSIQAAAALTGFGHENVNRAVDDLIGAHLIQQERAGGYFMHDLIHSYAADLASTSQDTQAALRRMMDWYLGSVDNARKRLVPDDHPVPPLPSEEDVRPHTFDTAAQALQWCVVERSTLTAVTALAARHDLHDHTWRLAACLEGLSDRFSDPHQVVDIFEQGYKSAVHVGNHLAAAGNLNNLGKALIALRRFDEAEQCVAWALSIFLEESDRFGAAVSRHNLATIRLERGDPQQAIAIQEEILAEMVALGNDWAEAHVRHKLGDSWRAMDRLDDAARSYQLALALRTKINDVRGRDLTLTALAQLNAAMGNADAAISYCEASLSGHNQTADLANKATAHRTLAEVLLERAPEQAVEHARAAVALYSGMNTHECAAGQAMLAKAYEQMGELANARDAWLSAHRTLVMLGDTGAAAARLRVEQITEAMSGIPDPRPNTSKIVDTQESC